MLGFDDLLGLVLVADTGVAVVAGVETFESELETRRDADADFEPGAMALAMQFARQGGLAVSMGRRCGLVLCDVEMPWPCDG